MHRTQHPSNNDVLRPPDGMTVEECNSLPITRIEFVNGAKAMASYWQPSPLELNLIKRGKSVRLLIMGSTHPPLVLGVDGDGLMEHLQQSVK